MKNDERKEGSSKMKKAEQEISELTTYTPEVHAQSAASSLKICTFPFMSESYGNRSQVTIVINKSQKGARKK